ncbi:MAG: phytanoyl-CoA dioxygenase family protein [Pseudomonadota bacterium]
MENARVASGPLGLEEIARFERDGWLLLKAALEPAMLAALAADFEGWVEASRVETGAYGQQSDGRPRFSLEPGHSAHRPALRRIASPVELSPNYLAVMRDGKAVDAVAQLIGPAIRFNNSKINSKHPGTATAVKYHQDFLFEPHSNDDLITVLYFLDDVTADNGPLEVVSGSHTGPLHDHWHEGVFTGAVSAAVGGAAASKSVPCRGPAGSACLMHTRLLHGSAPNLSAAPRTLFIVEYCAEDALPLQRNHIPSRYAGELVRGTASNRVRCSSYEMAFPEVPEGASFFEQQVKGD